VADRVALMRDGRIIQTGPPRELYLRPASRFAAAFLGEASFLRGRFHGVEDGRALVETLAGPLKAREPVDPVPEGAICDVVVRPEAVELVPAKAIKPPNGLRAEVRDVTFLGEMEQVAVAVAGHGDVKSVGVPDAARTWAAGDVVWLSFAPESASVFAADEAE